MITKLLFQKSVRNLCPWVTALHSAQSLETNLISAKPWAINRLVSSVTGEFLAVEKSREQLCHEGLGADIWTQLMMRRLASIPPCHIAVPGSQRTPGANLPTASRRMCRLLLTFHKDDRHIQPSLRTPHLSPWHQLQEPSYWNLQTPRKDSLAARCWNRGLCRVAGRSGRRSWHLWCNDTQHSYSWKDFNFIGDGRLL